MSSSTTNYSNPVMDIDHRIFVSIDSRDFKFAIQLIHEEFNKDADCVLKYCGTCNDILTRAGARIHEKCNNVYSSTSIAGNQ